MLTEKGQVFGMILRTCTQIVYSEVQMLLLDQIPMNITSMTLQQLKI